MASSGELVVAWMDPSICVEGAFRELKEDFKKKLAHKITDWYYFDNDDALRNYVEQNPNETIILITTGHCAKRLLGSISANPNIDSVFVFCGRIEKYHQMKDDEPKIRGIYDHEPALCQGMKEYLEREFP